MGCTKGMLQELLGAGVNMKVTRIDEGGLDGDLCALVAAEDHQVAAVVWPTAEKLKQIKALAQVGHTASISGFYGVQAGSSVL